MELNYHHQEVNKWVASGVAKRLGKLTKLEIVRKCLKYMDLMASTQSAILTFALEILQKSAITHSIEKPILLYYVNLSKVAFKGTGSEESFVNLWIML